MVYEKTFREKGFCGVGNWRGVAGDQFDGDGTVGEIL